MSMGKPISLPSWVLPCFHFQGRYCDASLSAPSVFRSTNCLDWGSSPAMSSPLMPVMSGTDRPAARVVVSFCLKSPPMTDDLIAVCDANCVTASATTLSLSPPAQYQRAISLLPESELFEPGPPPHAAVTPPAAASRLACNNLLRDNSTGVLLIHYLIEECVVVAELDIVRVVPPLR